MLIINQIIFGVDGKFIIILNFNNDLDNQNIIHYAHLDQIGDGFIEVASSDLTFDNIISEMVVQSKLIMSFWAPSYTAFELPEGIGNYCVLTIEKGDDSYIKVKVHDLQYNNVYKKSRYASIWTDWKSVADSAEVNACFQSVSNGKALVASAITDKGIDTAQDATFAIMANNIEAIETYNPVQFDDFFTNCGQWYGNNHISYDQILISSNFLLTYYLYFGSSTIYYLSHTNPFRNKETIKINWKYESNLTNCNHPSNITFKVGIGNTKTSYKSDAKYYYTETYQAYYNQTYSKSGTLTVDLSDLNEDLYIVLSISKVSGASYNSSHYAKLSVTSVEFV